MVAQISEIYIYPVKSLAGIKLERAKITKFGIAHPDNEEVIDRKWLIIDTKSGSFKTQRQLPRMALIKPSVEKDALVLNAPGKEPLRVPIQPTTEKIKCRVWTSSIDGYLYPSEIGKWLSEFLETEDLNLVSFRSDLEPRNVKGLEKNDWSRESDQVIYEDYSPFMLISEGSLADLNSRLPKNVTMKNFRPNFVAKGCNAYEEDDWTNFSIGETNFAKIKHCTRCLLTTVDPDQGVKDPDQQPLKTLKEYRLRKEQYGVSPMFGVNLASDNEGSYVQVNDSIIKTI